MLKKTLATAVILLFIGLAVAPSINGNVVEDEMVEVTTEFIGIDGKSHSVMLTNEEVEELDLLFEDIQNQLDNVKSKTEAAEIYNNAVVAINDYGLLEDISLEKTQKLISKYANSWFDDRIFSKSSNDNGINNYFCLLVGTIYNTMPIPIGMNLIMFFYNYLLYLFDTASSSYWPIYMTMIVLYQILMTSYIVINFKIPVDLFNHILFLDGSCGWLYTLGLNGIQGINGGSVHSGINTTFWRSIGIRRFSGIALWVGEEENFRFFYLGSALQVKVE